MFNFEIDKKVNFSDIYNDDNQMMSYDESEDNVSIMIVK